MKLCTCYLMHMDFTVLSLSFDMESNRILSILKVHNIDRVPIGVALDFSDLTNTKSLSDWWFGRGIPGNRDRLEYGLYSIGISDNKDLLKYNYGVSLTDCYWMKEEYDYVSWFEVNYHDNAFLNGVGKALIPNDSKIEVSTNSPDNTTVGFLPKYWRIDEDGRRVLIKGNTHPFQQEPYNEVIASRVFNVLGIDCVDYSVMVKDEEPYSVCEVFTSNTTELITAHELFVNFRKNEIYSLYGSYIKYCKEIFNLDSRINIDQMITVDYILGNVDRHWGNFGLLRDTTTLTSKIAPMFDTGNSLSYNTAKKNILRERIKSRPFLKFQEDQIALVKNVDCINRKALCVIPDIIYEILKTMEDVDFERVSLVIRAVSARIDKILML